MAIYDGMAVGMFHGIARCTGSMIAPPARVLYFNVFY